MVVLLVKGYSQKIHEGNNSDLGRHSLLFALPNLCTVISPGVKQSMSLSRFGSAITRTAPRIVAPMPKRHLALPAKDIPAMYDKTTAEIWLADPGVYPIVIIISGACVFCATYYTHNLMTNPDIRISKTMRKTTYRTWGMTAWGHH